ncbi:hypothetical protein YC2023_012220 [Brassica napus]
MPVQSTEEAEQTSMLLTNMNGREMIINIWFVGKWGPIVDEDYSWKISFWSLPLHLWTDNNLKIIGNKMEMVQTVDITEGRILFGRYRK